MPPEPSAEPEALVLGIAKDLAPVAEATAGGTLVDRVEALRSAIAKQTGRPAPAFRVVVTDSLRESSYAMRVKKEILAQGDLILGYSLAFSPNGKALAEDLVGFEASEPVTGYAAYWLAPKHLARARNLGYTVRAPIDVLVAHVEAVLKLVALR